MDWRAELFTTTHRSTTHSTTSLKGPVTGMILGTLTSERQPRRRNSPSSNRREGWG